MKKVLIANRGEIACRIISSCRSLDLKTVAVYSEADANALHVEMADEAVALGAAPAKESYLRIDKILQAMADTNADAVHPGYGFLAENPDFVDQVKAAGYTWVGPDAEVMKVMGDKGWARKIADEASVPVLPGSARFVFNDEPLMQEAAAAIGYPLLVKACAGGGGIGMKQVDTEEQLNDVVDSTQKMAKQAFGDSTVYLEKYIPRARHIEIQVFGYGNGETIHLYERECSIQRRFQKVIEESPAPNLPVTIRDAMANAAAKLCRAVKYAGAGTIEFIVDADTNDFYFLEMNTRIQVEHPVTEMTTGLDLVAMQLKLASGQLDAVKQTDVKHQGHAIECRLYAENPAINFIPCPGKLEKFELPEQTDGIRIDSGFRSGDEITFHYDPMIAKIICHADNRSLAIEKMSNTLDLTKAEGIVTNRDFLYKLIGLNDFGAGKIYTGFINDHQSQIMN